VTYSWGMVVFAASKILNLGGDIHEEFFHLV